MIDRTNKPPMDALQEGTRVGSSRMIAEGTTPDQVTKDQAQAVIDAALEYLQRTNKSRTSVAKSIGIAASTLGQVLSWKYIGAWQQIIIDLDRWLIEEQDRDAAPRASTFIWTKVADEIRVVADIASTLKTIGLVYGPETSGIGKTMALRALKETKAGSALVTIEKASATPSGLMAAICLALRLSNTGDTRRLYGRAKDALAGTSRLLMIDQIHSLCHAKDDRAFFYLMDLFDATGAPQLWCGTSDIVAYFDRGQAKGKETLAQIRSRIGISRDLLQRTQGSGGGGPASAGLGEPLFTIDEIRAIFGKGKMRIAPDAARYLLELANLPDAGGLRTCTNLVLMATAANKLSASAVLTADVLRSFHRLLVNARAFGTVERRLEEARPTMLAKVG